MHKLFFAINIILLLSLSAADTVKSNVVVLELFTSQGCSSCPSADRLVNEVQTEFSDNVISLSYHVDYWNYIGWKDPFSKKTYSDKQRAYSSKFFSSSIYTPQVVINGKEHFVGSNKAIMYSKLKTYFKDNRPNVVEIHTLKTTPTDVVFNYTITGGIKGKTLRAVLVIKERETVVKRGENRNRTLKNTNIVVAENYIHLDAAIGKGRIAIPDLVQPNDALAVVLLVQNDALDITGGQQVAL
jgi:hypothetical protein